MTSAKAIGKPVDRVDGRLKVTGGARYAAETQMANVTYGVLVTSTIAKGKIVLIDPSAAEKMPGILAVLTHRNAPRLPVWEEVPDTPNPSVGQPLQPLRDDVVHHNGQPVAVVVADTLEREVALRQRIKSAMTYPVVVFGLCLIPIVIGLVVVDRQATARVRNDAHSRLAFEASVTCAAPLERFQMSHASTVPKASSPREARGRAPET